MRKWLLRKSGKSFYLRKCGPDYLPVVMPTKKTFALNHNGAVNYHLFTYFNRPMCTILPSYQAEIEYLFIFQLQLAAYICLLTLNWKKNNLSLLIFWICFTSPLNWFYNLKSSFSLRSFSASSCSFDIHVKLLNQYKSFMTTD